jgi:prepilin-type N-terminal cleavage/methylation domain-containing protein
MKNNKKAFTLIELLVMVALISIVSATIFYNYNVSDSYFSLERSAQGIGQEIRIAQQKERKISYR